MRLVKGVISYRKDVVNLNYTSGSSYIINYPDFPVRTEIHCYGGGGAGGGISSAMGGKGGGSGGQYSYKNITNMAGILAFRITVGAVKTGTSGNAGAGNDTFVESYNGTTYTEVCRAKGGAGAVGETGGMGATSGGMGDTIYAGGNGADGVDDLYTYSGGGGGGAGIIGAGGNASQSTGGTANGGESGDGGNGRTASGNPDGDGFAGIAAGGGGGGAHQDGTSSTRLGGDGQRGHIRVTYYY
jgi:hypothetical protein